MSKRSGRVKGLEEKAYRERKITATDIVRNHCLNKTIELSNGIKIKVNDKVSKDIFIGANTTLLLDNGRGEPIYIYNVL